MTLDQLIDATFDREGRVYGDTTTHPPIDQPTAPGGITQPTLSAFLGRVSTLAELQALTVATARPIVEWDLRRLATRHGFDQIADEHVRCQMIDFAYNSGPALAIRWLQRAVDVPRTGVMDTATLVSTNISGAERLVNQALLAARLQMLSRAEAAGSIDKHFDVGLENRAFTFSELEIP